MNSTRAMVLRSVHLPPAMDEELRTLAFGLRVSKADLIRGFVNVGLERMHEEFGREASEVDRDRLLEALGHPELPESEWKKSEENMHRMRLAADEFRETQGTATREVIEQE